MNRLEALLDANIALLSKTVETSKKGKNLKAEFVRDDGAGGKYYGYMRGGRIHVIHERPHGGSRGRFGGANPYKQQLGAEEGSMEPSSPNASSDSAVNYGGDKVSAWRSDAQKILGDMGQQVAQQAGSQAEREAGAVSSPGGAGGAKIPDMPDTPDMSGGTGRISKDETKLENIVARLAEAYAQYLKIKGGKDYNKAFQMASKSVQGLFKLQVLQRIKKLTGHNIIYDVTQNQFVYSDGNQLTARDQQIVDSVVAEFTQKANKAIKAKQTAVRRAEGSNE